MARGRALKYIIRARAGLGPRYFEARPAGFLRPADFSKPDTSLFQILQIFGFLDSQSHWLCFRLKKFIFLGKGWKPISQVKVSELPVWLLRRDWSPNGVMKGFSRGWWRWNFAYSFRPGKGSYAALIQFALSYSFVMAVIEFGRKSKFCYLFNNLFRCVNIVF